MSLTVKNLKNKTFQVEIGDAITVSQLKENILKINDEYPIDKCKLIFNGKILKDDDNLEQCNIKDGCMIIIMKSPNKVKKENPIVIEKKNNEISPPVQSPPENSQNDVINSLTNMGFTLEQSKNALQKSNGDVNTAIGILLGNSEFNQNAYDQPNTPVTMPQNMPQPSIQMPQGPQDMPGLVPEINAQNIQQLFQDPFMMQNMIQMAAQADPQMAQQLQQNPELIQQMLQNPEIMNSIIQQTTNMMNTNYDDEQFEVEVPSNEYNQLAQQMNIPNNVIGVQLTEQENSDINELVQMGFPKNMVMQAYLSSGKQKEHAINLLVDGVFM